MAEDFRAHLVGWPLEKPDNVLKLLPWGKVKSDLRLQPNRPFLYGIERLFYVPYECTH